MDAISALETAACILAVTEFIAELLSPDLYSKVQTPLSLDGKDEQTILGSLEKLRIALSDSRIRSVTQQPSASGFRPLDNVPDVQDLMASRDASAALLEDIESVLRWLPDQSTSQPLERDTKTWWRSRLAGTLDVKKLERLSHAVTSQVSSLLRYLAP